MIHIVYGPPCAGKSTFVETESVDGDLIVDFDKLAAALGSTSSHDAPEEIKRVAFRVRASAITAALKGDVENAWIIHTRPTTSDLMKYRDAGSTFHLVDPGQDACLERSKERPEWTADAIGEWYDDPPTMPIEVATEPAPKAGFSMPEEGRMKFKTAPVSVKAVDADTGIFEAIVSVFGNKDSYGDVVMPGAFTKTLEEWNSKGDPIPVYWSHRMDDPDYNIGYVLDAKETDEGLWVKAQLDVAEPSSTSKAPQVHRLLKGRRVTQFSFAYDVIADKKVADVNELHELKLYEVGPTPIGANQATELLDVKSATNALVEGLKAGRVLSAKNESEIRAAIDDISTAAVRLHELLPSNPDDEETDEQKASGNGPAADEEPSGAKSDEPSQSPSAKTFAQIQLLALNGQKGDS